MGRLHCLEFTAVIGPNGAGKSNLMDAISFVLGMRSQQLRSSNLKDLVYRGLTSSQAPEDSPTSAFVKIVYEKTSGGQRIEFKRTITTSGSSDYLINDKAVSYADYNKALEAENILVKARNFLVFQGDVEAIASQSPKDLTKLIEQVSGSIELKHEYEELKALQDQTIEDSAFSFNKKRGMAAELKQFQEQKKEAERYEKLKEEKQDVITQQVLWTLFHAETKFLQLEGELEADDKQVDVLTNSLGREEDKLKSAKADQSRCQLETKKFEGQARTRQAELEHQHPEVLTCQENLAHATAKLEKIDDNSKRIAQSLNKQKETVTQLEASLKDANRALDLHKEKARRIQEQNLNKADLAEYHRINHDFVSATFNLRQELEQMERPERVMRDQTESAQQNVDQLKYRETRLKEAEAEQTERVATLEASLKQVNEEKGAADKELAEVVAERLKLDQQEKEANERLTLILNDLVRARLLEQASSREKRLREGLETLKRVFPGVHGRVVDVIRPSMQKYETAILTILASNLEAVIVDQEATAFECIKFLKEQRLGLVKFLPLDTVVAQPIPENFRRLENAHLGIDVIQFDQRFERAIQYAAGSALVCDSLKAAKHICFTLGHEVKAVALDGTVIHRNGNITGGGAKVAGAAKAARQWEEKKMDELRTERDHLLAQLNDIQRAKRRGNVEEGLRSKIQGLQANKEFLEQEKSKNDRNLKSTKDELTKAQKDLKKAEAALRELTTKLTAAESQANNLRNQIAAEQDKRFAKLCAKLKLPNIRQYEESQMQATKSITENNLKYQAALSKLQNQLDFETRRLEEMQQRADQLQEARTSQRKTLDSARSAMQDAEANVSRIQAEIAKIGQQLASAQKSLAASTLKAQECQRSRDLAWQTLDSQIKAVTAKESSLNRFNSERLLVLRRCKLEEIALPLNMGDLDNFEDEEAPEGSRIHSSRWMVEVDYQSLPKNLRDAGSDDVDQDFEKRLAVLSDEMDRMAPNMKALDKMDQVQRRALETQRDLSEARTKAIEAKTRFNEVKLRRYQLFYNAFEHIAHAINDIYKDLTKNSTFPMGGTAYLTLENNEEPYLDGISYHAMPPMKRFGDMEKLSGGEKSVAALALLFAIHSFQPSPFFVLDEVDAALDNDNVAKVARYLRHHSTPESNTQFVVISLKSSLFEKSHSLVGVCRDQTANSSKILTLDLEQYDRHR
ncbi:Structural maintenance of chromosomes protein 1 [Entomophthora muscae]|uniref:Structural maintenance of chromosomes protein 1 n=2 Tax=Entomophthora muscae TaxID=34485 RepID=A0ACC2SQK2_9FUNG|nr:Structural maintenance of chromosomes protein 1 [Entomophthora muscae]